MPILAMSHTILNVDDNEAGLYAKTSVLQRAGCRVLEARSGAEALRLVAEMQPSLVLLDVGLPDMSGLDVCRLIKDRPSTARTMVLQISASRVLGQDRAAGLERGADGYLLEPVEPEELTASVNALLRLREREDENQRLVERLREGERRFHGVFEQAAVGLCMIGHDGRFLEINDKFCALAGRSRERLMAERFRDLTHEEDRAEHDHHIGRLLLGGISHVSLHQRLLHEEKGTVWIKVTFALQWDSSRKIECLIGVIEDIDAEKRVEVDSRERERFIGNLLDTAPGVFYVFDLQEQRNVYRTAKAALALGYTQEELDAFGSRMVAELLHPDDHIKLLEQMVRRLPTLEDGQVVDFECRVRHKSGEWRWFNTRNVVFARGRDGITRQVMGTAQDITDRKVAEEKLGRHTERLELLAQAADVLLTAEDPGRATAEIFATVAEHLALDTYLEYGVNEQHDGILLESWTGVPDEALEPLRRLAFGQALCGTAAQRRTPMVVEQVDASPDPKAALMRKVGARAYVCFPLVVGERLLGVLAFASKRRDRFDVDEIDFLRLVCHYVAMAKERRRLLEEATRRAQRLEESELRLQLALDAADVGIFEWHPQSGDLVWDERGRRHWGLPSEEGNIGFLQGLPAEDRPAAQAALERALDPNGDGRYHAEHRIVGVEDPVERWIDARGRAIFENGRPSRFIAATTDITTRKQAEERLLRSEDMLDRAQRAARAGVWEIDLKTHRITWSDSYCELFGYDRAVEPSIERWLDRIHPEDRAEVSRQFQQAVEERTDQDMEFRILLPDGTERWVHRKGRVESDAHGIPMRVVGIAFDVTERRRMEVALRESEERLRFHVGNAGLAVVEWDANFTVTRWAGEAEKMFGWSAAETIGKHLSDLQIAYEADLDIVQEVMHKLQEGLDRTVVSSNRNRTKDGRIIHCTWNNSVLLNPQGRMASVLSLVQDETAQVEAEEALRHSHAFIRQIIDTDPNFIFAKDREGRFTLVNQAVADCYGSTVEQLVGKRDADFNANAEEVEFFRKMDLEVMDGLVERFIPEEKVTDASGATHWLQTVKRPLLDDQGRAVQVLGVATDITQRMKAEARIAELNQQLEGRAKDLELLVGRVAESESRIRLITDSLPVLISYIDRDERYRFNNLCYEQWLGESREAITGRTVRETLGDAAYERLKPHIDGVLGGRAQHFEERVSYRNAGVRHVDVTYMPDNDASGNVRGFFVMVHDISERKRLEEALRAQEEQLRVITDSVPSMICYVDHEERYRFVNAVYEQAVGRSRAGILGHTVRELLGDNYSVTRPYLLRALAGESVWFESPLLIGHADRTFLASYVPDITQTGEVAGVYMLMTEITERKRMEDELRRWAEELETRVDERTREVLRSHERLRTLAYELSATEQRERRRLAAELHDYLAQLLVVARMKVNQGSKQTRNARLAKLLGEADHALDQSLTYTRSLVAELSPPVLYEFGLPMALRWLGDQMARHGLTVDVRLDENNPILSGDQGVLVFQCVRELLFNVVKHAGTNCATMSMETGPDQLEIVVSDKGSGFAADADSTVSDKFGLFSVKERMEAMGGSLQVTSETGRGTQARIRLPLGRQVEQEVASDESPAKPSGFLDGRHATEAVRSSSTPIASQDSSSFRRAAPNEGRPGRAVRVLLVDDHAVVRQGMRGILDSFPDMEVVGEASDGYDAIELARGLSPDVVVMDISMPRLDGIEATKRIKAQWPSIAIIGLSVHNSQQVEQAILNAGAAAFLTKECAADQLYQAIERVVPELKAETVATPQEGLPFT